MIDYIMLHILSYFFTWFGKKRGGVQKKGGQKKFVTGGGQGPGQGPNQKGAGAAR